MSVCCVVCYHCANDSKQVPLYTAPYFMRTNTILLTISDFMHIVQFPFINRAIPTTTVWVCT